MAEEETAISGEVRSVSVRRPRRNLAILNARVSDGSGEIMAVWVNQAWVGEKLQAGTQVRLRGRVKGKGFLGRSFDLYGVAGAAVLAPVFPARERGAPPR